MSDKLRSSYETINKGKISSSKYDPTYQKVQNLFHRNAEFMQKHRILGKKRQKNKRYSSLRPTDIETSENNIKGMSIGSNPINNLISLSRQNQLNNPISLMDQYNNKNTTFFDLAGTLRPLLSQNPTFKQDYLIETDMFTQRYQDKLLEIAVTSPNFTKHFSNSDETLQELVDKNCLKQKQRIEKGYKNTNESGLYGSSGRAYSFEQYSSRKEQFQKQLQGSNNCGVSEDRFNNFSLMQVDSEKARDMSKSTERKYDVFKCVNHDLKYDYYSLPLKYQKNNYSSLHSNCLFDYNREKPENYRQYYQPIKLASDLPTEQVLQGITLTSPFKRSPKVDLKKSLGREKKINFNSTFSVEISRNQSASITPKGHTLSAMSPDAQKSLNTRKFRQQYSPSQMLGNSLNTNTPDQPMRQNQHQPPFKSFNMNASQHLKQQRANSANSELPRQQSTSPNIPPRSSSSNSNNPLSIFRERMKKMHKLLNID